MIKTRAGREIILPNSEEDASINAAALSDPDAQPLSDAELARLSLALGGPDAAITRLVPNMQADVDVMAELRASDKCK